MRDFDSIDIGSNPVSNTISKTTALGGCFYLTFN